MSCSLYLLTDVCVCVCLHDNSRRNSTWMSWLYVIHFRRSMSGQSSRLQEEMFLFSAESERIKLGKTNSGNAVLKQTWIENYTNK